ncbi:hypothetical protein DFH06DRAFT_1311729 [Mycena polygramma]|nr:hypothetical protein DFH06DRAFT_1311729 [Mycena polygramma]
MPWVRENPVDGNGEEGGRRRSKGRVRNVGDGENRGDAPQISQLSSTRRSRWAGFDGGGGARGTAASCSYRTAACVVQSVDVADSATSDTSADWISTVSCTNTVYGVLKSAAGVARARGRMRDNRPDPGAATSTTGRPALSIFWRSKSSRGIKLLGFLCTGGYESKRYSVKELLGDLNRRSQDENTMAGSSIGSYGRPAGHKGNFEA